jgi:UDP-N-acetylmuramate--alanine ligase
MCGAAALLRDLGACVSGSDLVPFDGLGTLVSSGVRVSIGHDETHLHSDVRLVVVSAAVPESNVELSAARRRGLLVLKYAEFLGALTRQREGIAIGGTHGKSTTSGMCVHLFQRAGLSPSFIIGARSAQLGGSSGVGDGPHLIVESCEFDRSFLQLRPRAAAILNIEPDHLDCYRDLDEIIDAFTRFAAKVHPQGLLVYNADDSRAAIAASSARAESETFGFCDGADWRAYNLRSDRERFAFDVEHQGTKVMSTRLSIPGRHNVANALAAIALTHHAGGRPDQIAEALPTFAGVDRRLTWRGEGRGITILDDYAHHPTEVRVTIAAARSRYAPRRTWVVFQPHQYSRTHHFMDQFAESFGDADEVIIPDVYGARESPEQFESSGSQELVSRICRCGGRARYLASLEAVTDHLTSHVAEGDMVLTMGAGDVWKVADELVERFCEPNSTPCAAATVDVVPAGRACSVPVPAA